MRGPATVAGSGHVRLPPWQWAVLATPFAALAVASRALGRPWALALLDGALLAAAIGAHAACYARWHPFAPRLILVNELLTRLWFAGYSLLVGHWLELDLAVVAGAAPALAAASWALHAALLRRHGYRVPENVAHLGAYLLALGLVLHAAA